MRGDRSSGVAGPGHRRHPPRPLNSARCAAPAGRPPAPGRTARAGSHPRRRDRWRACGPSPPARRGRRSTGRSPEGHRPVRVAPEAVGRPERRDRDGKVRPSDRVRILRRPDHPAVRRRVGGIGDGEAHHAIPAPILVRGAEDDLPARCPRGLHPGCPFFDLAGRKRHERRPCHTEPAVRAKRRVVIPISPSRFMTVSAFPACCSIDNRLGLSRIQET
jgi:hypothetical protein